MGKTHRGKGIRHLYVDPNGTVHEGLYNNGRGTCPISGRTGVKLLYEHEVDGKTIRVCKRVHAAIKRGKIVLPSANNNTEE